MCCWFLHLCRCGPQSAGRWSERSHASWWPWRCATPRCCCLRCPPSPSPPHRPERRHPAPPPGAKHVVSNVTVLLQMVWCWHVELWHCRPSQWLFFIIFHHVSACSKCFIYLQQTQWRLPTVKALGRVLLHLQCCGRLLQRKLGLSVCTRPLGSGALLCWKVASCFSSCWLTGGGLCFTGWSEKNEKCLNSQVTLCWFDLNLWNLFSKCFAFLWFCLISAHIHRALMFPLTIFWTNHRPAGRDKIYYESGLSAHFVNFQVNTPEF